MSAAYYDKPAFNKMTKEHVHVVMNIAQPQQGLNVKFKDAQAAFAVADHRRAKKGFDEFQAGLDEQNNWRLALLNDQQAKLDVLKAALSEDMKAYLAHLLQIS